MVPIVEYDVGGGKEEGGGFNSSADIAASTHLKYNCEMSRDIYKACDRIPLYHGCFYLTSLFQKSRLELINLYFVHFLKGFY